MRLLRGTSSVVMISMIVALISTNILSLTNAKFHDFLYGVLSHIPNTELLQHSKSKKFQSLSAENERLRKQNAKFQKTDRLRRVKLARSHKIFKRIARRTAANVSLNVSSVLVEAIPYAGIAAIIATTSADVYTGCETIKDTNRLMKILDGDVMTEEEIQVCGITLPSEDKIMGVVNKYNGHLEGLIGGVIYEMVH
ncbi:hypothetical protein [Psychromonas sp.]|uniref:hypothetical protein n=1 Tax=Psychromonas sp. TaxID=1884585 RepID=UPI003561B5AF